MSAHSYAECLQNSYRVNWTIVDVVGGRHFDATRPWLPARLRSSPHRIDPRPTSRL